MANRQTILDTLREQPDVSVLIIGGGVNGIGTFRDLALQGVDVLLVDKADFCSGASAASSHMAHGGLRYLENGEFRLVHEALIERNRLLQNAPHYVHPLPTTIPIFSWFSGMFNAPLKFLGLLDKPSERGAIIIKAGLTMYDWFTRRFRMTPTHVFHSRAESLVTRPGLNPGIVCTATYYDAWMPYPERICIELLADAETSSDKARALNYVSAIDGEADTVTLRDELTGETFTVKPQIVINAAGPWIDFVNQALDESTNFIGGTKGSHLVLDHPELHKLCDGHELFFENKDGRITLFFPLLDRVLVGTTDIHIDDPEQAICTDEEIDYMLDLIRVVFPDLDVNRSHVVFQFCGVRPLPSSDATTAGQISRDHSIRAIEPDSRLSYPVLSLVGGKWTSFRAFSEQVTDNVLARLKQQRLTTTRDRAIGGGRDYPKNNVDRKALIHETAVETGLEVEHVQTLFERYGTRVREIAAYLAAEPDTPLGYTPGYSRREVQFLAETEKVVHLDDLLLRRTLLAMLGKVTPQSLHEITDVLAAVLDWDDARKQAEIERVIEDWRFRHGVNLAPLAV
ncbi:MAG: glycerol-3-phosphate dehydrogenase/oxidase [Anaerolineae bacterium]|nr:glycerol-3-phosphate dehydrogenase/oxidase [Anaerolineae bacterium]